MSSFCGDLVGQKFNYLTVVRNVSGSEIEVLCDCGTLKIMRKQNLRGVRSCGCKRRELNIKANTGRRPYNFIDLIGRRFGRLVVVERLANRVGGTNSRANCAMWLCRCDCGKEGIRPSSVLLKGRSKSCGCWSAELSGIVRRLPNGGAARNANLLKYKNAAKYRNLEWSLSDTQFDILTSGNCFYCGIEPRQICKASRSCRQTSQVIYNGIDRIDNTKGYIEGNAVSCCKICNRAKSNMSQEDFLSWAKRVAEHSEKRNEPPRS